MSGVRRRPALLLALLGALSLAGSFQAAAPEAAPAKQVYRAERKGISVSLSKRGRYLKNVHVEAAGRCTDGRKTTISFAIIGAGAIQIASNGRFNMTRRNAHELRVFKGRVEGDVIRGFFRRFSDGSARNGFEPRCGTGNPYSRPIYFVAR